MTLPNFLIVGAPKAGTTSLYDYLRPHPEIFMPAIKGPRYFIFNGQESTYYYPVRTLEQYEALFAPAKEEKAIGEATALYFEKPEAAQRIKEVVPDARIIVTLREPVQRAFSIYHMNLRDRGTNSGKNFLTALRDDQGLRKLYYDGLKPYYDLFGANRIKILLFEDLSKNTLAAAQSLFEFLDVDKTFVPDLKVSNPGGVPRVKVIHDILADPRVRNFSRRFLPEPLVDFAKDLRSKNLKKHGMTDEERNGAYTFFAEDIRRTQDLIGIDLSNWLRRE